MQEQTGTKITQLIEAELVANTFVLFDLQANRNRSGWLIQVLIDHPEGGITMQECVDWNRLLGERLESTAEFGEENYTVEVSSPGVDYPLVQERDFKRVKGKRVRVTYREAESDATREIAGQLMGVEGATVIVKLKSASGPTDAVIPLQAILRAKQEVIFKGKS